jgi:hypothetical protein
MYVKDEMAKVAAASADSFLRKLRHMLAKAKTPEQRSEALSWCKHINLIPASTRLPLKARLIRFYIKHFI